MIDEIIAKISAVSNNSEEDIRRLIEDKQVEFSGLISEEGAAYLVAKELGVHLKREEEHLNIGSIMPGMQNVDVTGKITFISPIREFKTERAEGRVANVIIADKTGSIRMSLWNDEIDKLHGIELGDVVNISGFVKESNGQLEVRLGRRGFIMKSAETGFDDVRATERKAERSQIKDLREGAYRSVRAAIMQVFESNIFYEICPECKKRLKEENDGYACAEHGVVEPDYGMRLSGIIDDSTGNIRAVFFTDAAEKLLGLTKKDAKKLFDKKKKLEALLTLVPLGRDFVFDGRVNKNDFFDRMEFVVNTVHMVDVKKEIEMLTAN
jgi:ssDNA-binding replication factor A large subunit